MKATRFLTRSGVGHCLALACGLALAWPFLPGLPFSLPVATAEPEALPWSLPAARPLNLVLVRGLWNREYALEEGLARAGGGQYDDVWVYDGTGSGWTSPGDQGGGGLIGFPDRIGLMDYQVVVAVNVNARCFGDAQAMLVDYVRHGGSALFLGGRFAFGGQYRESGLASIMPVEFPGQQRWNSDLRHVAAGLELKPGADAIGRGFATLSWDRKPLLYWYHDVIPKAGAKVLLTAGGKPMLVAGESGKGRVAVFAGTVMGDPQTGQLPFWKWDGWPRVLAACYQWLGDAAAAAPREPLSETIRKPLLALASGDEEVLDEMESKPKADAVDLSLLMACARSCHDRENATFLLGIAVRMSADLTPDLADVLAARVHPFANGELAKPATALVQSGKACKIALGLHLLGASRAAGAEKTMAAFYRSGKPLSRVGAGPEAADGMNVSDTKVVLPKDEVSMGMAIRLGALEGLGALGTEAALAILRPIVAEMAKTGAPRPADFCDVLTDDQRLYQQAVLSSLRCGDSAAAVPLVAAVLENVYTIARGRTEANKPKDRLGRIQSVLGEELAWQQRLYEQVTRLPDAILPMLAKAVAAQQDRRVAPLALAAFGNRELPAPVRDELRRSPVPAVAALADAESQ